MGVRTITVTVTNAQKTLSMPLTGNMINCIASDQDSFNLSLDDNPKIYFANGVKYKLDAGKQFTNVIFENTHATDDLTITIVHGIGEYIDSRLTQSVSGFIDAEILVANTTATVADQSIADVTATSVAVADSTRKEVWLQPVTLGAGWRWGDSNVSATRGMPIPDAGLVIESTAQIYVFQNSGGAATIAVNELTKV